jgi:undecaprenyl-diphosphatase
MTTSRLTRLSSIGHPGVVINGDYGASHNTRETLMIPLLNTVDQFEGAICVRVNRFAQRHSVRRFFAAISKLGDGYFWLLLALACLLSRRQDGLRFFTLLLVTATLGVLVYRWLKTRLIRERPYVAHPGINCGTAPLDQYSFPSGHTLHAVSFAILFSAFEPALLLLVAPFAVLVAASRIVLGLHYPSDVLAGAVLGGTLAFTVLKVWPLA